MTVPASVGSLASSLLALQIAQALLTAAVLWVFQRRFGYPVLAYWIYGWVALAGQLVGVAGFETLPAGSATRTLTIALAALTLACGYLKVIALLVGAFAVAGRREVPISRVRAVAVGGVALAFASALPFATDPAAVFPRYVSRIGLLAAATGIAQVVAGVVLWARTVRRLTQGDSRLSAGFREGDPALGQRLVAAAFIGLGALTLYTLVQGLAQPSAVDAAPVAPPLEDPQLLLNFALGLGLVIWLLEGEQRRTLEAAQRAEHMAYHDPLTGLPNRLLLVDRLRFLVAHARRSRQPFAVFFLDIDHFKSINDTYGHAAGDRLLQQLAARLTAQLREADTVARLGGDEFVILTPDLRRGADVAAVGEKLLEAVRPPMSLDDHEVRITVSIGVSVFPEDGEDADVLLRRSDGALYQAKEEGRDAVRLA